MEDFVIYGEVGRGSASVVYKGRQSGTLAYVAVQSLELSTGSAAANKHQLAAQLQHPNVLSVFKHCETPTQHWVVMEFCPGGDLAQLLAHDTQPPARLPAEAIWQFAVDLAAGLQHCHARGVVVGDLRPARVLVENGWLKIGSLSRGFSVGALGESLDLVEGIAHGAKIPDAWIPYAAPEVVQYGVGAASYASDLWALGCIIFELVTGATPFFRDTADETKQAICAGSLPGTLLASLPTDIGAVLAGLFRLRPIDRLSWLPLAALPFWRGKLLSEGTMEAVQSHVERLWQQLSQTERPAAPPTPPAMEQTYRQPRHSSSRPDILLTASLENQRHSWAGLTATFNADDIENGDADDDDGEEEEAAKEEEEHERDSVSASGDLGQAADDDQPTPLTQSEKELPFQPPPDPITTTTTDDDLDALDCVRMESANAHHDRAKAPRTGPGRTTFAPEQIIPSGPSRILETTVSVRQSLSAHVHDTGFDGGQQKRFATAPAPAAKVATVAPPRNRPATSAVTPAAEQPQHGDIAAWFASHPSQRAADLVWHASDSAVAPILGNVRIEKLVVPAPSDGRAAGVPSDFRGWEVTLPSTALAVDALVQAISAASDDRAKSSGAVARRPSSGGSVSSGSGQESKVQRTALRALHFLQTECCRAEAANIVINSAVLPALLRLIRAGADTLREQSVFTVGILLRFATVLGSGVHIEEVLTELADCLRAHFRNVALKAKLLAAYGEGLFYAASQSVVERKLAAAQTDVMPVEISGAALALLKKCLRVDEAPVVLQYAMKTIENLLTVGGEYTAPLPSNELALVVWAILRHSNDAHLRRSCAYSLAHMGRQHPAIIAHLVDKIGPPEFLEVALDDSDARVRAGFMTIIALALQSEALPRLQSQLAEFPSIVEKILRKSDTSDTILRAKSYLAVSCLLVHTPGLLGPAVRFRLVINLEKDNANGGILHADDAHVYLASCGACVLRALPVVTTFGVAGLGDALAYVAERKHPSPVHLKKLRQMAVVFPAIYQVLASPLCRPVVLSAGIVHHLARVLSLAAAVADRVFELDGVPLTLDDDVLRVGLGVVESILPALWAGPHAAAVLAVAVDVLVPALIRVAGLLDPDASLAALRVLASFARGLQCLSSGVESAVVATFMAHAHEHLVSSLLAGALRPTAVEPLPVTALKLLNVLLSFNPAFASTLAHYGVFNHVVAYFFQPTPDAAAAATAGEQQQLLFRGPVLDSEAVVAFLRTILRGPGSGMGVDALDLQFVQKLAASFCSAAQSNSPDAMAGIVLDLVHIVLQAAARAHRDALGASRSPAAVERVHHANLAVAALGESVADELLGFYLLLGDRSLLAARSLALHLQLQPNLYPRLVASDQAADSFSRALLTGDAMVQALLLKISRRALRDWPSMRRALADCAQVREALAAVAAADFAAPAPAPDRDRDQDPQNDLSRSLIASSTTRAEHVSLGALARAVLADLVT